MRNVTVKLRDAKPIPHDVEPKPSWGRFFNRSFGFSISPFKRYTMSVFVDSRLKDGNARKNLAFLQKEQVVARCISCVGEVWELRSEPIAEGLGLTMYTAKGKAIAAGVAKAGPRSIMCKLNTLYPGITNATKTTYGLSTSYNTLNGSWTITGTVTATPDRK
jgi:hypothetical protein